MNIKTLFVLLLLGSFTFTSYSQGSTNEIASIDEKLEHFLKLTDTLRKKGKNPGLAMAIIHNGEFIFKGGMGFKDVREELPVTNETLFEIGSLTKAFTGLMVSKLVEKDLIQWNDKIITHYPKFKLADEYATQNATLQDLLVHRTGVAQHYYLQYGPKFTISQLPNLLPHLSFDGTFREKFLYNNLIYTLAGLVTEKISGQSWNELIENEIFIPLNMNNSFTRNSEFKNHPNRSSSYRNDGQTLIPSVSLDAVAPAGSITSTIDDMSIWLKMLVDSGKIGNEIFIELEQLDYLMSPHTVKNSRENIFYGIGWDIDMNRKTISHNGRTAGQSSRLLLIPEADFGIVVLCNQQTDLPNLITRYAANIFVRNDFERLIDFENHIEKKTQPIMSETIQYIENPEIQKVLPKIEGKYSHPAYGEISLTLQKDTILSYEYYEFKGTVEYGSNNKFIAHTRHYTGKDTFPFKIILENNEAQAIVVDIPYSKPVTFKKHN